MTSNRPRNPDPPPASDLAIHHKPLEKSVLSFSQTTITNEKTPHPVSGCGELETQSLLAAGRWADYFTFAFRSLPAVNRTVLEALIFIGARVLGLIPVRALRVATLKVPKPTS